MSTLPNHLPQTVDGAAAHIYAVTKPTADDLTVMLYLEAAGEGFYASFAEAAPNEEVRAVFKKNGQEEVGHAHRVSRALKLLYSVDRPVPEPEDNPYYDRPKDAVQGGDRRHRRKRAGRRQALRSVGDQSGP